MPDFDTITCEACGRDLAVPKGNPDSLRYHRGCAWYEMPCEICSKPMRRHRDWDTPPRAHKACKDAAKAERAAAWYELPCAICLDPIQIHREWINPPRAQGLQGSGRCAVLLEILRVLRRTHPRPRPCRQSSEISSEMRTQGFGRCSSHIGTRSAAPNRIPLSLLRR